MVESLSATGKCQYTEYNKKVQTKCNVLNSFKFQIELNPTRFMEKIEILCLAWKMTPFSVQYVA